MIAISILAGIGSGACDGSDDSVEKQELTTTTAALSTQLQTDLGSLHRSQIREIPDLVALFYHHPDGWAVEDVSLDRGATWCRHAWYRWEVIDAVARDNFSVDYQLSSENPACLPSGDGLVMHVTDRSTDSGLKVLAGEYTGLNLNFERTVCPGTIDDWADVCGESSDLGVPTPEPSP